MTSSVILKKKNCAFTAQDILDLIEFSNLVKAYSKAATLIHNTCTKGAEPSEYQLDLKIRNKQAKNKLKFALKQLKTCNTPNLQQKVLELKVEVEIIGNQIQLDIERAKKQYLLIRQSNWIFVTIYEIVKSNSELLAKASFGHSLDTNGHTLFIIEFEGEQISCPQGFTNLALDADGFQKVLEHQAVEAGIYYETRVKEITDFKPELLVLIQKARAKYITYDVK